MARKYFPSQFRIGLLLFLPMMAGCLTPGNHLTYSPQGAGTIYRQQFKPCYMLRTPAGDYHFVLVDDGVEPPIDQSPDAPIQPAKLGLLRQLVHVHVFWRPIKGAKPDNPSSTNAALDWYFIAHAGLPNQSLVHYEGSGFVTLNVSTKSAAVHVRSVAMRPETVSGSLHDALGDGNVSGDFLALLNPGQVRDLFAEIKSLND